MKRIEYKKGQVIGNCVYLTEREAKLIGGRYRRIAVFMCNCGKLFEATIEHVKSLHTTSCGCVHDGNLKTHGMSYNRLYKRWEDMLARCYNKNKKSYKNYGGRGIVVCVEWRNDFKAYHDYVMSLWKAMWPGLTIDRINNDGNYEPGNIRWATRREQSLNSRRWK